MKTSLAVAVISLLQLGATLPHFPENPDHEPHGPGPFPTSPYHLGVATRVSKAVPTPKAVNAREEGFNSYLWQIFRQWLIEPDGKEVCANPVYRPFSDAHKDEPPSNLEWPSPVLKPPPRIDLVEDAHSLDAIDKGWDIITSKARDALPHCDHFFNDHFTPYPWLNDTKTASRDFLAAEEESLKLAVASLLELATNLMGFGLLNKREENLTSEALLGYDHPAKNDWTMPYHSSAALFNSLTALHKWTLVAKDSDSPSGGKWADELFTKDKWLWVETQEEVKNIRTLAEKENAGDVCT